MDLISKEAAIEALEFEKDCLETLERINGVEDAIEDIQELPSVAAVPLDKLCELLAEMYHCPGSGWPSSGHSCHPYCPDEAFEELCGTDCDKHTDAERWKVFLKHWMEEQDAAD